MSLEGWWSRGGTEGGMEGQGHDVKVGKETRAMQDTKAKSAEQVARVELLEKEAMVEQAE